MDTTTLKNKIKPIAQLLHYTFSILPIAAGLDKYLNLLTDWTQYINPMMEKILPFSDSSFMKIIGVIEILAGILTFIKPKIGGYIVSAWLTLIALTLLSGWMYVDLAVRDIVMAIAAYSMVKLINITD